MEIKERQRSIYATARQKKKLIELIAKHPELIACKVTNDFKYKDSQMIWQNIANECNTIPGAKKTWRQWRKTWHDLRSKTKKKHAETNGELTRSTTHIEAEQETLQIKNVTNSGVLHDLQQEHLVEASLSESESIPEEELVTLVSTPDIKLPNFKKKLKPKNSDSLCNMNCDMLAAQEQKKLELKEDYLNFKKEYLKQKLKLLKEQNDALKCIAKELSRIK